MSTNFNKFAETVGIDRKSGVPIRQTAMHRRWDELLTAHDHVVLMTHAESGVTTQIAILRTLWELARDPELTFLIVANNGSVSRRLKEALEKEHSRIFGRPLREGSAFFVQAFGSTTGIPLMDHVIINNVDDPGYSHNADMRKQLVAWFDASVMVRAKKGVRVVAFGSIYDKADFLHTLAARPGYVLEKFPLLNKEGESSWSERFPPERIEMLKSMLGPREFARACLCSLDR